MGDPVIYGALGYYLYQIHKANQDKPGVAPGDKDEVRATLANRGSFVPWLLGARRVGPIVLWVGDRLTKNEPTGARGGGKGSKKTGRQALQPIYYESAQHGICVGPASRLARIWRNGRVIFETSISADSNPSGSSFTTTDGESFRIYWGERDQAKDSILVDRTGIDSRRPNLCYIMWDEVKLGPEPRWPVMEYEIEVRVSRFEDRYGNDEINEATSEVDFNDGGGGYTFDGANPSLNGGYVEENVSHKVDQLLTGQWPQGLGLDAKLIQLDGLALLGSVCESEQYLSSLIADGGKSAADVLQGVLDDFGCVVYWKGIVEETLTAGQWTIPGLAVFPVRPVASYTPPTIPDDATADAELPEVEVSHWGRRGTKVSCDFPDRAFEYAEQTVTIDDDSGATITVFDSELST